jgi:hypothetical protein
LLKALQNKQTQRTLEMVILCHPLSPTAITEPIGTQILFVLFSLNERADLSADHGGEEAAGGESILPLPSGPAPDTATLPPGTIHHPNSP